ncbi:MAG TPA: hypothetical protein VES73_08880, partial [Lamprocystis sp. (in: g-proteobacteria)]|nr:hypothetical protein [Lamprocystis sp. (in: g-proteobacteria)]
GLLHPRADHSRVLGLPQTAMPESITAHDQALVRLFRPNRAAAPGLDSDAANTARIHLAYHCRQNPRARVRVRAHLDRALTGDAQPIPGRHPEPWRWLWAAGRPESITTPVWLFGGTVVLVAAALVIMLGTTQETLSMADPAIATPLQTPGIFRATTAPEIAPPTVPPDFRPAGPVAAADPPPAPPLRNRALESATPKIVEARRPKTAMPWSPPVEPAKTPEVVIARFQRHFDAGDLAALLLLLTDDARIVSLADPRAPDAGTDFFAAAVKRTLRLTARRPEPHGERQFVATGTLRERRRTATGPVGEVRLELTGEEAGFRISALLYRIDPKHQDPRPKEAPLVSP